MELERGYFLDNICLDFLCSKNSRKGLFHLAFISDGCHSLVIQLPEKLNSKKKI